MEKNQKIEDNSENHYEKFSGFPPKPTIDFWCYPKALDKYWHCLNGSEQKVLDYILRHTWGFDKTHDEISLSQLMTGIKSFDKGTGLSKPTVISAIQKLIIKGFIKKTEGKTANNYEIVKDLNYPSKDSLPSAGKKDLQTIEKDTIDNKQYTSDLSLLLKNWNERQNSPIPNFLPENIIKKHGTEKVAKMIEQYGKINGGFSQFLRALKNRVSYP